jgi:hypothetical protein
MRLGTCAFPRFSIRFSAWGPGEIPPAFPETPFAELRMVDNEQGVRIREGARTALPVHLRNRMLPPKRIDRRGGEP